MKRKQQPSSKNVVSKDVLVKKGNKFPKKKPQNIKQKKNKNKAMSGSSKFTLDTHGRSTSEHQAPSLYKKITKASGDDVLGYDSLLKKER